MILHPKSILSKDRSAPTLCSLEWIMFVKFVHAPSQRTAAVVDLIYVVYFIVESNCDKFLHQGKVSRQPQKLLKPLQLHNPLLSCPSMSSVYSKQLYIFHILVYFFWQNSHVSIFYQNGDWNTPTQVCR